MSAAIGVLTTIVFASASVSYFNAPQTVARVSYPWVGHVVLLESLGPQSGATEKRLMDLDLKADPAF